MPKGQALAFGTLADVIGSGFHGAAQGREDARRQTDSNFRNAMAQQQIDAEPQMRQFRDLQMQQMRQGIETGQWETSNDPVTGRVMRWNRLDPSKQQTIYPGSNRTHVANNMVSITKPDGSIEFQPVPQTDEQKAALQRQANFRFALERAAAVRQTDPQLFQKYMADAAAMDPASFHSTFGADAAEVFTGSPLSRTTNKLTSNLDRGAMQKFQRPYHELSDAEAQQVRNEMNNQDLVRNNMRSVMDFRTTQDASVRDLVAGRQYNEQAGIIAKQKATLRSQYNLWSRAAQDPIAAAQMGTDPRTAMENVNMLAARMMALDNLAAELEASRQRPMSPQREPGRQAIRPKATWADLKRRGMTSSEKKPGG